MNTKSKSIIIHSSPEKVFAYMDNLINTRMHMMKSSAMIMAAYMLQSLLLPEVFHAAGYCPFVF